jgi:hypothetical protein
MKRTDRAENWAFEAGTPSVLFRGYQNSLLPGTAVVGRIPGKDGSKRAIAGSHVSDGRTLFLDSSGTGAQQLTPQTQKAK